MNNDFIDIMHERLSQHLMPEPEGLWHDIDTALKTNKANKGYNLARWGKVATVAAAIIAVVVMFRVLRNQEPQATYNGSDVAKTETPRKDVKMPSASPEEENDVVDQSLAQQCNVNNGNAGKATAATTEHIATEPAAEENIIKTEGEEVAPSPQKDNQEVERPTTPPTPNQQSVKTPKNEQREPLFAINSNTRIAGKKAENKINVSLYYSGIGTMSSSQAGWDGALNSYVDPPSNGHNSGQTDEPQFSNDPNDYNYHHQVPIRVGAKVAYNIGDKWRIGSGLIFTRLKQKAEAKAKVGISYQKIDGTFNYLGVPVDVSRNIWKNEHFQVYATVGAMIEFNVTNHMQITRYNRGKKTVITHNNRDHRPQFSTNAGIGAQYNIIDKLGIYVEPGVSYHFNNGSDIYNLYKDKPFNFDLNLGIRLNIGK